MNDNNQKCQATIDQLGLHPRIVQHEPILNLAFGSECMSMEITADELRQLLDHLYPDNIHYLG